MPSGCTAAGTRLVQLFITVALTSFATLKLIPPGVSCPITAAGAKNNPTQGIIPKIGSLSMILLLVLCKGFEETRAQWDSYNPSALSDGSAT